MFSGAFETSDTRGRTESYAESRSTAGPAVVSPSGSTANPTIDSIESTTEGVTLEGAESETRTTGAEVSDAGAGESDETEFWGDAGDGGLDTLEADPSEVLGLNPEGWSKGGTGGTPSDTTIERKEVEGVVYLAASVPELEAGSTRTFSWRLTEAQQSAAHTFTGVGFWLCGTGDWFVRASEQVGDDLAEYMSEVESTPLGWQYVQVNWEELGVQDAASLFRVGFGATQRAELRVVAFQFLQDSAPDVTAPAIECP